MRATKERTRRNDLVRLVVVTGLADLNQETAIVASNLQHKHLHNALKLKFVVQCEIGCTLKNFTNQ